MEVLSHHLPASHECIAVVCVASLCIHSGLCSLCITVVCVASLCAPYIRCTFGRPNACRHFAQATRAMPPIRIEHDSDCWSTLGPSETEVQPKYYERRSSAHRSAPSMQLLHGRRHSVCKRHPRTRTWSFSFSFSRFSLMQPSLLLLPKTVACSYPEGGT